MAADAHPEPRHLVQMPRDGEVLVGLSAADSYATDCIADLGPLHPAAHGMARLRLAVSDGVITSCDPVIGQMHRGAEKLFESRDYRQVLLLTDRHDWLSPVGSEIGAALCMEHMLGIEVSQRAQLLRMAAAEMSRIAAHAMFVSEFPMQQVDEQTAHSSEWAALVRRWRELRRDLLDCIAVLTGARVHVMWNVIGGVLSDADEEWCERAKVLCDIGNLVDSTSRIFESGAITRRLHGVGVIGANAVRDFGITGITARAAGVPRDARRQPGYLRYCDFMDDIETFSESTGCAHTRMRLLITETAATAMLARSILPALMSSSGPINVQLPKTVRLPEGSVYRETENALGINGYWLMSTSGKTPHRLKIRSASFNTLSALPRVLPDTVIEDLVPTLATIFFVAGDSDR